MKHFTRAFILLLMLLCSQPQSFTQTRTLNPDSLILDIDYLEEILTAVHPGIYRYNTEVEITHLFQLLRNAVNTRSLTEKDWMLKLAQTVNHLKCGHTYLNPWNMNRSIRSRLFGGSIYFPLGFRILNGAFVVTDNLSRNSSINRGDVILSINDIPTDQILDSLRTIAKTDGHNLSPVSEYLSLNQFEVNKWEAFDLYFHLFFGVEDSLSVQIETEEGLLNLMLPALSKAERAERFSGPDPERWSLNFDEHKAIMKLGTFATWNWKGFNSNEWFRNAFARIDSAGLEHLVIDLRGNGGGLGAIKDELLSYLTDQPIPCPLDHKVLVRALRVDDKFKPYSDTWVDWVFNGLDSSQYSPFDDTFYELEESSNCQSIQPQDQPFTGTIYFLGGSSNVSATFRLLEIAKDLDDTYFIGAETGGNQQGINGGEYIFFYLPYSKMEIDIPLKYFYGGPGRGDSGIIPDFRVTDTQQSISRNEDLFLQLIDQFIVQPAQLSK